MSLATRCTACGTIFRVVQDQLKVSEGWVRCGRCNAVFQATEALFDLEREAPPAWGLEAAMAGPTADELSVDAADDPGRGTVRPRDAGVGAAPARPAASHDAPTTAEATLRALSAAAAAADVDARRPAVAGAQGALTQPARATASTLRDADRRDSRSWAAAGVDTDDDADAIVVPSAAPTPMSAPPAASPAFVRRAQKAAFWRGWRARLGLAAAALVLLLALAAQVAQQFSDIAAARWPEARAALTPWCRLTGCSLAAPRRIDEVLVESTSLAPEPGTEALRIGIVLRNRAPHVVALPAVDLSLTDSTGRLIARRTLQARDFKTDATALPAHADVPMQALLLANGGHVTGYTVEIFYP